jgi:hypothetical protein
LLQLVRMPFLAPLSMDKWTGHWRLVLPVTRKRR